MGVDAGKVPAAPTSAGDTKPTGGANGGSTPNGGKSNSHGKTKSSRFVPRGVKFEGKEPELKGFVYDIADNRKADMYARTTKEIAEYIGKTYHYGNDVKLSMEALKRVNIDRPKPLAAGADDIDKKILEEKIKLYIKKDDILTDNLKKAYVLVWGQCSESLRTKIEGLADYSIFSTEADLIRLLKEIQAQMMGYQSTKYLPLSIHEAKRRFYLLRQDNATTQDYLERFTNAKEVIEHCGGSIGNEPKVFEEVCQEMGVTDASSAADKKKAAETAKERCLAVSFLMGSDRRRYHELIVDLENDYTRGQKNYPETVTDAYNVLINWRNPRYQGSKGGSATGEVAFVQDGQQVDADGFTMVQKGRKDKSSIICFNCNKKGHYSNECPEKEGQSDGKDKDSGQTGANFMILGSQSSGSEPEGDDKDDEIGDMLLQDGTASDPVYSFSFLISGDEPKTSNGDTTADMQAIFSQAEGIPDTWILLDNQSTVDIFSNPRMLKDIRTTDRSLSIHCNAGVASTNLVGDLPGYGTVWYHPTGIANVLSLSRVSKKWRITYDSRDGDSFVVHKDGGTARVFKKSERGLFFLDTARAMEPVETMPTEETALVQTVKDNKDKYSTRDVARAELAREIQKIIGRPSTRQFLRIVDEGQLPNCPVTREDILAAEAIFGPDVGSLKGKTTYTKSIPVNIAGTPLPMEIMSRYQEVVIGGDIMFLNKIPFFMSHSRHVRFGTSSMLVNQQDPTLLAAVKQVVGVYHKRGFKVGHFLLDGQFESLRDDLAVMGIELNSVGRGEHVPEAERYIRTVKERVRSVYNSLPYRRMPGRMIIELVAYAVFWLNSFPHPDGISATLSPRSIVTGQRLDFNLHCRLEFGTYVQVHEEHDNSMASRTTGALALRPTGNAQGGYFFLSLSSGRRISRNHWTVLPLPTEVIDRVHVLARRRPAGLHFGDRYNNPLPPDDDDDDDAEDPDYLPPPDGPDSDDEMLDDAPPFLAGVDANDNPEMAGEHHHNDDDDDDSYHTADGNGDEADDILVYDTEDDDDDAAEVEYDDAAAIPEVEANVPDEIPGVGDQAHNGIPGVDDEVPGVGDEIPGVGEDQAELAAEMDARYGARGERWSQGLRPRKPRDFGHLHATLHNVLMTQYTMKKGLRKFGSKGSAALTNELKQLHIRKVLSPKYACHLSKEEKEAALQYLMFLKEKRCGKIKARGCADGRKQRVYMTKEETSSPTVSLEALMLSCVIDAEEGRDVATADIPGAFMQADMKDVVHLVLEGTMAELFISLDPDRYKPYATEENGRLKIYFSLEKALYGTLQAALLFWEQLTEQLKEWGFTVNPYDECVANMDVNGSQCTIVWYVDDLKISHKDASVVTDMIKRLEERYGREAPLTVTRGRRHDYLGMQIDFTEEQKVTFSMKDYIDKMLSELPDDMKGVASTPAAMHLFETNDEEPEYLNTENAEMFHHNVAKLLFLCKRARPDIQTAVAFLCTRVKNPDEDDYHKLARVMKYLRGTREMGLRLEASESHVIKWWVDASFAVHKDARSHTGGIMSMGRGAVYATSTRQKITTKSSTEAELVGVDDVMGQVVWTRKFLEAQGWSVQDVVVGQDNKSAILLERNGRASSGKRTRHINIRYFFVKDRIRAGEMRVVHCPTQLMVADFFTKPLQGSLFKKHRKFILNLPSSDDDEDGVNKDGQPPSKGVDHRSVLGDLVGNGADLVPNVTNNDEDASSKKQMSLVSKEDKETSKGMETTDNVSVETDEDALNGGRGDSD